MWDLSSKILDLRVASSSIIFQNVGLQTKMLIKRMKTLKRKVQSLES